MGCYNPNNDTIFIYLRDSPESPVYPYFVLLDTAVHEAVHCMQWRDPLFIRYRGVMHDTQFHDKYNYFSQFVEEVSSRRG